MTKEELRQARERLGLTQAQLAQQLGVTLNAVQKWEMGERPIRKVVALAVQLLLERSKRKNAAAAELGCCLGHGQ